MQAKLIKTAYEYEAALQHIESLLALDSASLEETDELELLVHLVEIYEDKEYPIDLPSPIEAIKFKMEQQGLKQKDLVPFIGSKSKVSEVLSGKRPLTLNMIRALAVGLHISADILVQKNFAELPREYQEIDYSTFPIVKMHELGEMIAKQSVV